VIISVVEDSPDDQNRESVVVNRSVNHDPTLVFQKHKCGETPTHVNYVVRFHSDEVQKFVNVWVVEDVAPLGQHHFGVEVGYLKVQKEYLFSDSK